MTNTNHYLDQLDILSSYMKYWVEFKDKERVEFEKTLEKELPSISRSIAIVNTMFGDNGIESTISVTRRKPLPFSSITKTFSQLRTKNTQSPKERIIKSINKFV